MVQVLYEPLGAESDLSLLFFIQRELQQGVSHHYLHFARDSKSGRVVGVLVEKMEGF